MKIILPTLLSLCLLACTQQPTVRSVTPAASPEEQQRAKGADEVLPDYASTGIDPKELIDTWIRTKVRNVTDNTELVVGPSDPEYSIQFKSDRTFINFDGQKRENGTWRWNGNQIELLNANQSLTILTVGEGYLTWQFTQAGKTYMYSFKSARKQ